MHDTKEGTTHSYPIITIEKTHAGWYIKMEKDPSTSGTIFITDPEIKTLQYELNKKFKNDEIKKAFWDGYQSGVDYQLPRSALSNDEFNELLSKLNNI